MIKQIVLFLFLTSLIFAECENSLTTTNHEIMVDEKPLKYQATCGFLDHFDENGELNAKIFFTAYVKEDEDLTKRPITFCFNGGPGSSSVWVHMGALGPKRFPTDQEGEKITPPYDWVPNNETLLDTSDLVFIDPVGTGFSYTIDPESKEFWEVDSDISSVGNFIRSYITQFNRWRSPKYLAGESYGTTRAAGLSHYLHSDGIYLNGVILISIALDYSLIVDSLANPLSSALLLPTLAATSWHYNKLPQSVTLEETVQEAVSFLYDEYFQTLLKGSSASETEKDYVAGKLANYSALPKSHLLKNRLKVDMLDYSTRFLDEENLLVGLYDTRYHGNAYNDEWHFYSDPSISLIDGVFTSGFSAYVREELGMINPKKYETLSHKAHQNWDFSTSKYNAFSTAEHLRSSMQTNPELKIYVASGYFDLVTPFAAGEYLFSQFDDVFQPRIETHRYIGGHMFYLDRTTHPRFKNDLKAFYSKD